MPDKTKNKLFGIGVPPWVLIGSVAVLFPIFAFMTIENINRQKEKSMQLLIEKGAALIRSFEAGTRTGMMGMHMGNFNLQQLLSETAQQSDIVYLLVADINGRIIAHNDLQRIGRIYGKRLDLEEISREKILQWRQLINQNGINVFEVFRKFSPTGSQRGMVQRHMMMHPSSKYSQGKKELEFNRQQIIFVGLDMTSIEEAQKADIRHAVVMGAILLLIGFSGITLIFLVQNYQATRATLSRIKAFSDNVVENMPIGLIALDDKLKIAAFNQIAESVLQLSSGNVVGKKADRILPAEFLEQIKNLNIENGVVEQEIDYRLDNNRTVPLEIGISQLQNENGIFLGYVILFKDMTEVHALRKEISRTQRLASVGRLAAGIAHEIRNPLSSIKGFATYFKELYQDIPEDVRNADIMIQEVDRLNRVINQLLEFAKPVTLRPKSVYFQNIIYDSIKLIEQLAKDKSIVIIKKDIEKISRITADPDRINQVLLNLYLNAIESMDGGGELVVSLSLDKSRAAIVIQISDTGHGIRKDDLANIFDPYFTTKPTGTGLGLAIAHNVIEAIGGEIEVESRPGHGTTFRIIIPISDGPQL